MKSKIWMTVKLIAIFVVASPLILTLVDSAVSRYNNNRIQAAVAKSFYDQDNQQDKIARNSK